MERYSNGQRRLTSWRQINVPRGKQTVTGVRKRHGVFSRSCITLPQTVEHFMTYPDKRGIMFQNRVKEDVTHCVITHPLETSDDKNNYIQRPLINQFANTIQPVKNSEVRSFRPIYWS